jgi:hypothetical protein
MIIQPQWRYVKSKLRSVFGSAFDWQSQRADFNLYASIESQSTE